MKKKALGIILLMFMLVLSMNAQAARISRKKATVKVGKTIQLRVIGAKKAVKWSSSNRKVATVTGKGIVRGKRAGKTTITAGTGGKKYRCVVTVRGTASKGGTVSYTISVALSQTEAYMKTGDTLKLKATVSPAGIGPVEWYSLDSSVASVRNGLVTAKKEGTTEIVASVTKGKATAWMSCGIVVSTDGGSSESSSSESSSSESSSSEGSSSRETVHEGGSVNYGISAQSVSVGKELTVTVSYTGSYDAKVTSDDTSVLAPVAGGVSSEKGKYTATFRGVKAGSTVIRIRDGYGQYEDKVFNVTVK